MPKTWEHQANYLNWVSGTSFPAVPSDGGYVALLSGVPPTGTQSASSVTAVEIDGSGYERAAVGAGGWGNYATDGSAGSFITNLNELSFSSQDSTAWNVSGFAIFSTQTGVAASDALFFEELASDQKKQVTINDVVKFVAGALRYREK